ncbi:aspartate/glutamate racemase family protein [Enterovibrio paralichthyis]|uniref:maleate cis-trans isomerase family protein n=1 Tax=Enterovibrio paralichthyis TaxID=2853805 RepID=UPI001C43DE9B|nr:aspartate/glutamate racemase family protein [Enterovibrio paralichthyis]MBV7296702.1 aspartate/glutamate racemase family protein [Enterovibrio paralichthyis]
MNALSDFKAIEQTFPFEPCTVRAPLRIGLVQLSTDYTLETDWHPLVGGEIELYSTRMYASGTVTVSELTGMKQRIANAAAMVAPDWELDVMAFGCTSASMLIGDETIQDLLTHFRPGVPATNPWRASCSALQALGAQNVAVMTPYTTEVNAPFWQAMYREGFDVSAFGAFQLDNDTNIPRVSVQALLDGAKALLDKQPADAIFIPCTNMKVMKHINMFEKELSCPLVTSNQAMFWHAMCLAGYHPEHPFHVGGKLLQMA